MEIKNILAVRNDRFGEFLLSIPAFRALKRRYPQAKLTLMVNPYLEELARCVEGVDQVLPWPAEKHKFSEILKISRQLKQSAYDISLAFNPSKEINIITFLAGIPVRIGYNRKWAFLLTSKIKDKKYLGNKHEIDYNLELAGLAGVETQNITLSLSIDNHVFDQIEKDFSLKDSDFYIAVHPWTSDKIKQWPLPNFYELIRRLSLEYRIVIIGGKEESGISKELFSNLETNILDLTGKTSLKQLAAILSYSKVLISGDSGPVHLASCVGTPVLAIFRNDMPEKCALRWGPRSKGSIVIEKNNLNDISVEEVLQKTRALLKP